VGYSRRLYSRADGSRKIISTLLEARKLKAQFSLLKDKLIFSIKRAEMRPKNHQSKLKSPHRRTCISFVARVHGILLDIYLTSRRLLFAKTMQVFLVLFLGIFLMRVSWHSNARANESENWLSLLAWEEFHDHKEFKNFTRTCEPCTTQVWLSEA
jgi:hypothetical protein